MDDRSGPADALFAYVPQDKRNEVLHDLINSLRYDEQFSVHFIAALTARSSHEESRQGLLSFLQEAIQTGHVDCAVSTSLRFPELGCELLSRAAQAAQNVKSPDRGSLDEQVIQSYLSFANLTISRLPCGDAHAQLLQACLGLIITGSAQLHTSARDVIFTILSTTDDQIRNMIILPSVDSIWNTVLILVSADKNKQHTLLGYSLWLRLAVSLNAQYADRIISHDSWRLLLTGLKKGDFERRKICLSILKTTIAADSTAVTPEMRIQLDRYCTVFETIVLGRYINQVQECENDLNVLASNDSLPSEWLFTLLASALGTQMQDSNRKFIGNWILNTIWKPTSQFIDFFREDFLPWAMQGTHFVATLREKGGEVRCIHGDRLSEFIEALLRNSDDPDRVTDIVVDLILRKRNSLFAYTLVYLLEGLATSLRHDQKLELSNISGLPEVARDYVSFRTQCETAGAEKPKTASRREAREQSAIEKCKAFDGDIESIEEMWAELDALEYPKTLLMAIPGILLHGTLIQRALEDEELASSLKHKLETLRNISRTKTFLFSPLLTAIRNAVATNPDAVNVLALEDLVIGIAEHPPTSTIDLMLEEATTNLTPLNYEHYFGNRPSYGFAALFDIVSRLREHQATIEGIIDRLLERWKNQNSPPPTVSPWKSKLQLQILLLCFEQYNSANKSQIFLLLNNLFHILAIEPLPHYRYLLEWMIVRMITKFDLSHVLLERLGSKDHHSNPKHLASLMKIGVILACDRSGTEEFAVQIATAFIPLAASSKIVIRHEAQWQVPLLMNQARKASWTRIIQNPAFIALDDYIRSSERFHDPPAERQHGSFNPETDHTLTNLVEGQWLGLYPTDKPFTSHEEFVKLYRSNDGSYLAESCMVLGHPTNHPPSSEPVEESTLPAKPTVGARTADEVLALQTKGTAYLARTLSDTANLNVRPNNLIVVGSLVDNPYNLGGLSRVSEIFGASALCLQNQNVVNNKDFTSVAVSSHLHFPLVQLSAAGVPAFLSERRKEGFVIVGIEQTDRSVILGSEEARLPEKVVLVVGSEKEGIPAVVLTECDLLVEIPQQGVTRSLNVQTAVAIVLFEYVRQRKAKAVDKA